MNKPVRLQRSHARTAGTGVCGAAATVFAILPAAPSRQVHQRQEITQRVFKCTKASHLLFAMVYKKKFSFLFSPFVILYELTFENIWQHMDPNVSCKSQRQCISPDVFDEW
jgi:hypothetical protein